MAHAVIACEMKKKNLGWLQSGVRTSVLTYMAYFRRVGAQTGFGGEAFAADVAVERAVFGALHLGVVISQVLLQVRQLDERPPAVGKVTFVWTFT